MTLQHAVRISGWAICLLAALGGCTQSSTERSGAGGETETPPASLRLIDLLDSAKVSAPWSQAPAGGAVGGRVLWHTDFEAVRESDLGLDRSRHLRIVRRPDGKGHALSVGPGGGPPPAVLVEVPASALVRVERSRGGSPRIRLAVLELNFVPKQRGSDPRADVARVLNRTPVAGTHVSLGLLERQHAFAAAADPETLEPDRLDIFTTADTRSLLLSFEAQPNTAPNARALIDDIRVVALEPSVAERLAIVRERFGLSSPNRDPSAFAQFLPLPNRHAQPSPRDDNFEFRAGIIAPVPTAIRWEIGGCPRCRLSFEIGLVEGSAPGATAEYAVHLDGAEVARGKAEPRWQDVTVPVGPGSVELTLITEGDPGAIPVFGNPAVWRPRGREDPPDIYLFAIDTLRADRLSAYGYAHPTSPNLEALATDGVLFTNAVAQSNWTPESFAAIFTSQYAGQHGVTHRLSVLRRNTLADSLSRAGYFTQGIAYKLLLYDMGFERGFDAYYNQPRFHLSGRYDTHAGINWSRAAGWMRRHAGRQRFLFLHMNDPHQPFNHRGDSLDLFTPPERLDQRDLRLPILVRGRSVRAGATGTPCRSCVADRRFAPWFVEVARELYDGEVHYVDRHLGLFVRALKDAGVYDDAVIVVLSDHGEILMEHDDYLGHGHRRMYDPLLHVPLVIKPPKGAVATGVRVRQQVELVDVLPTILELAGVPLPASIEGRSLLPLMQGGTLPEKIAFSENVHTDSVVARSRAHKLTVHWGSDRSRETWADLRSSAPEAQPALSPTPTERDRLLLRDAAAAHVVRTHGDAFIVLRGPGLGRVSIESSAAQTRIDALIGVARRLTGRRWTLRPRPGAEGPLLAVRVIAPAAAELWVTAGKARRDLGPLETWSARREGPFERWSDGASRIEGRWVAPARRRREVKDRVRADELQALQALGYVDG